MLLNPQPLILTLIPTLYADPSLSLSTELLIYSSTGMANKGGSEGKINKGGSLVVQGPRDCTLGMWRNMGKTEREGLREIADMRDSGVAGGSVM